MKALVRFTGLMALALGLGVVLGGRARDPGVARASDLLTIPPNPFDCTASPLCFGSPPPQTHVLALSDSTLVATAGEETVLEVTVTGTPTGAPGFGSCGSFEEPIMHLYGVSSMSVSDTLGPPTHDEPIDGWVTIFGFQSTQSTPSNAYCSPYRSPVIDESGVVGDAWSVYAFFADNIAFERISTNHGTFVSGGSYIEDVWRFTVKPTAKVGIYRLPFFFCAGTTATCHITNSPVLDIVVMPANTDADDDGIDDDADNCPAVANADQADLDGDGIGDACDDDRDGDGVDDDADNCPAAANADQADFDGDGIGDACDDDRDGDGVDNADDRCAGTVIHEDVPTVGLGTNRWALVDDDLVFDTKRPNGRGPDRGYDTTATGGCSCRQIISALDLGEGHVKFGCSISAMDDWVSIVGGG